MEEKKRKFDLFNRTEMFAVQVALFCRKLPREVTNHVYVKQLIRSSSSIGANYIEANDALGDKDFVMRLRIARKEANESLYWLNIIKRINTEHQKEAKALIQEVTELKKILSAIIKKKEIS